MKTHTRKLVTSLAALACVGGLAAQEVGEGAIVRTMPRAGAIHVNVNARPVVFPDMQPIMYGDRVMVPIRGVFEHMGAHVRYEPWARRVVAFRGNRTVILEIGKNLAKVDGVNVVMDAEPVIQGDRTLVPLRFLAESLDSAVVWRPEDNMITITPHGIEPPFKPDGKLR
ncbi:MAG TPA: copper amine oxidase N-terminal domain-containing protein [Fimbriimonadaceae bacterium]|nr:copper amine oxidase N-terminal domain-containing protein [Fimbriimonadaceae bacterium]